MKISLLCSDKKHPVYSKLLEWCKVNGTFHTVELVQRKQELSGGDILFLISCHEIVGLDTRSRYNHTLVIHASDLPYGRGWSPMIWQVLEGKNEIVVTLLQAEDKVDSGRIWCQKKLYFEGHELAEEMNEALFDTEIDLMNFAVENESTVKPFSQSNERATFYRKRTPNDSKIDPQKSISSQFDLLRVSDPERYPAFFEHRGHRYKISISKMDVKRNE